MLHVIPSIAAADGGPSEAVIQMCRALAGSDLKTSLATTMASAESGEFLDSALAMRSQFLELETFGRFGNGNFKFSPALSRWLARETRRFSVIHVHAVFSHPSIAAMHYAKHDRRPYILRPLGSLSPYSLRQSAIRKRIFLECGLRDLIESAASLHCTSQEELDEIASNFRVTKAFVIPNGVDERLFVDEGTDRQQLIVFVGRLHPKKNCEILIEAFSRFSETESAWRLVIAGDGERRYVESLKHLARRNGSITFTGWLSAEAKCSLLHQASVFVLPSEHENFAIAAAEAMAAGVPVIVSDGVAIASDIVRHEAGWVVPRDVAALQEAMIGATRNAAERARRGDNARRIALEQFRWTQVALRLREEYAAVSS